MKIPLLPTYATLPIDIIKGQGMWLYDTQHVPYLDLYGGHAVALLGHNPKLVQKALSEQAQQLIFYSNALSLTIRNQAACALSSLLPNTHRHIFFCNSGAEANENALKLAIKLTGRSQLIAFQGAFHGRTLLAGALTDGGVGNGAMGPWIGDRVTFLPPNVESYLEAITPKTAAVMVEPIQSIAGVVAFQKSYLQKLKSRCQETGALLIFDEIQTGMGRCGMPFFSEDPSICPDLFTSAKGMASGLPIGALFMHDRLASHMKVGDLGSTFGGAPLSMAALLATVETLIADNLCQHARNIAKHIRKAFVMPSILEIRGSGCLIGFKLKVPAKAVVQRLLAARIIVGTTRDPYVLRIMPPLIVQKKHIALFKQTLESTLCP